MSFGSNAIFSQKTIIKLMMMLIMSITCCELSSASMVSGEVVEEVVDDIPEKLNQEVVDTYVKS